jgi:hypothetical protein
MCLYEPPILLGTPDLNAALLCALPLAMSARHWVEAITAAAGLSVALAVVHVAMVFHFAEAPPSQFYGQAALAPVMQFSLGFLLYEVALLYCATAMLKGLLNGQRGLAINYLISVLGLLGLAALLFGFLTLESRAAALAADITPIDCVFPPFGEGPKGYAWLGAICVFEMVVAANVANFFMRLLQRFAS